MLDFIDSIRIDPVSFDSVSSHSGGIKEPGSITLAGLASNFGASLRHAQIDLAGSAGSPLRIGLIDNHRFSQECLVKAFDDQQPRFAMLPFSTAADCILNADCNFDMIIYYSHVSENEIMENIAVLRRSFRDMPLIVLSDAEDAEHSKVICNVLKQGAHGFIPTRTMGIPMIVAAIRFVQAGGTFAPIDLLLTIRPEPVREIPAAVSPNRLTSRQVMVLEHLQQGKANKIIAHELGMSESTVKVHVRNIMRKMGATNRTQAAYKAKSFYNASSAQA